MERITFALQTQKVKTCFLDADSLLLNQQLTDPESVRQHQSLTGKGACACDVTRCLYILV